MARISRAAIFDILSAYALPGTEGGLVAQKAVKGVELEDGLVHVSLHLLEAHRGHAEAVRRDLQAQLGTVPGVERVEVDFTWEKMPEVAFTNLLTTVKRCVVVGSGKGGVGKSTVAANLACALAGQGLKVGLLDADLYGPSMGMMFGVAEGPEGTPEGKILPIEKFGLKLMSMAFLVDEDRPLIWRGPMLNKALQQLLGDVLWGDLDLLLIDLPPGTGDTQISIVQNAKVDGALVVSTPQDVAFLDAKKAIGLFQTVHIPISGVIENMSSFLCPHCHQETPIFGHGGVREAAQRMGLPFLGEVPIDLEIRVASDGGKPIVIASADSPQAKVFRDMARALAASLDLAEAPLH